MKAVHDNGFINESENGVTLSATRLYDFCDPVERGEWLDIVIALIEYLRSGTSYVGYLNNRVEKNMLHKDLKAEEDIQSLALSQAVENEKKDKEEIGTTLVKWLANCQRVKLLNLGGQRGRSANWQRAM